MTKISSEVLEKLNSYKKTVATATNEAAFLRAKAQMDDAAMRLLVAETLKELDLPVDTTIVCLSCGATRQQGEGKCPECGSP